MDTEKLKYLIVCHSMEIKHHKNLVWLVVVDNDNAYLLGLHLSTKLLLIESGECYNHNVGVINLSLMYYMTPDIITFSYS